jgi:hypothetical protein
VDWNHWHWDWIFGEILLLLFHTFRIIVYFCWNDLLVSLLFLFCISCVAGFCE